MSKYYTHGLKIVDKEIVFILPTYTFSTALISYLLGCAPPLSYVALGFYPIAFQIACVVGSHELCLQNEL